MNGPDSEKYHVFVSYSRADAEIAASVVTILREYGVVAFLDQKDLELGDQWEDRLRDALRSSDTFLCLLTKQSKNSYWVHIEAGAAWGLGKTIIPALFDVGPGELNDILRTPHGGVISSHDRLPDFLARVTQQVAAVSTMPLRPAPTSDGETESFTAPGHFGKLLPIGDWKQSPATGEITGRGMHAYLLSERNHAPPYTISAELSFSDLHPVNALDNINAGVVLGWTAPKGVRRYHNLVMNDRRMTLELIGDRGGDAYGDFIHLDKAGVPFSVEAGRTYSFDIEVGRDSVSVVVVDDASNRLAYSAALGEPALGRVGLRPWRSRIHCRRFRVTPV